MRDTALLVDSTTVLPQGYSEEQGVTVLPVPIQAAGKEYRDGIDLTEEQFLHLLETLQERPSTAVPGVGEFVSWYERLLENHKHVIYLAPSLHLSGLFNTAVQAARTVDGAQVVVVDPPEGVAEGVHIVRSADSHLDDQVAAVRSLTPPIVVVMNTDFVAGGSALITMGGLDAIQRGAGLDQVVRTMTQVKVRTRLYFILNRLDYVVDRVGQLQVFLGTLLRIRPILAIEHGHVVDVARARGEGKAKRQMLDLVKQEAGDGAIDALVLHSLALEQAQALLDQLRSEVRIRNAWIGGIGCTVSRYTGRGGLGIAFTKV